MERKFESELGKEVAAGRRPRSSLKLGVAGAAVASCALLVCLAGFSMAMGGSDNGGPPYLQETTVFDKEVDDLAWEDCDAAVKRVMSLKYKAVAEDCLLDAPFTKFKYGMNFLLNQSVDLKGIEVGKLSLAFTSDDVELLDLSDASATVQMTITGTDVLADGSVVGINYDSGLITYEIVDNALVVSVVIPSDLAWSHSAGDSLYVLVTIEVFDHALHGDAIETPWARYEDTGLFEDHVGVF